MEKKKKVKRWFGKKKKSLSEQAAEATRMGISYGQYKWRQLDEGKKGR